MCLVRKQTSTACGFSHLFQVARARRGPGTFRVKQEVKGEGDLFKREQLPQPDRVVETPCCFFCVYRRHPTSPETIRFSLIEK